MASQIAPCLMCGRPSRRPRQVCRDCWRHSHDRETTRALNARQQAKVQALLQARRQLGDGALADQLISDWLRR